MIQEGYRSRRRIRRARALSAPRRARARLAAAVIALLLIALAGTALYGERFAGRAQKENEPADAARPTASPVQPAAPLAISVAETELAAEAASVAQEAMPRVLIYHTHASEAYLLTEDEPYVESGGWRTLDNTKNVVAIGALLQKTLLTEHGIVALHDTGNYEAPKLATAYSRSLPVMERYKAEHPTVEMFIDVHRDAYGKNEENVPKDYLTLDGSEVARIMLVVGTGEGATGGGFPEMPDFAANLRLAERITENLRATDGALCRDIRVKTGRYNQHVSDCCMLVEVGHTANTFSQAANSVRYLAGAIAEVLKSVPEPDTLWTMQVWTP